MCTGLVTIVSRKKEKKNTPKFNEHPSAAVSTKSNYRSAAVFSWTLLNRPGVRVIVSTPLL